MLTYTVATDADGTMVYHGVPEEAGGMIPFGSMIPVFIILCKVGDTFVADNLRYLCVGMLKPIAENMEDFYELTDESRYTEEMGLELEIDNGMVLFF